MGTKREKVVVTREKGQREGKARGGGAVFGRGGLQEEKVAPKPFAIRKSAIKRGEHPKLKRGSNKKSGGKRRGIPGGKRTERRKEGSPLTREETLSDRKG